jgi:hypothetical protein
MNFSRSVVKSRSQNVGGCTEHHRATAAIPDRRSGFPTPEDSAQRRIARQKKRQDNDLIPAKHDSPSLYFINKIRAFSQVEREKIKVSCLLASF